MPLVVVWSHSLQRDFNGSADHNMNCRWPVSTGQLFFGEEGTEYGELGKAVYGRLKWAF
jgi:hypothetical protein